MAGTGDAELPAGGKDWRAELSSPQPWATGASVPLSRIVERSGLLRVAGGHLNLDAIAITTPEVNRPGLQLTGYVEHFSADRLQIIGWIETAYLSGLDPTVREERLDTYFSLGFPALVVARGLHVMHDMVAAADRHNVPVFATDVLTSEFASALTWQLVHALAPRTIVEASLVDVYGEGVLLVGDIGVGKRETALELVRRGHRLISAHRVELRRVSEVHLRGFSPEGQWYTIDIPGVGAFDVEELFGAGAIKPDARVTLVVSLETRDPQQEYERVGLEDRMSDVFGVQVTRVTIPVQPGRNLAVIIEAAALNHRMRGLGYNAARDLMTGVGEE